MFVNGFDAAIRLSDALSGLYVDKKKQESILSQIESIQSYFEQNKDVSDFLKDYALYKDQKKEVITILSKALSLDDFLINSLLIMVDKYLISYMDVFLSSLKNRIFKALDVKNIYVYSSFPIVESQVKKIESLWRDRLNKECKFYYAIDKSLKLGIKVQVDMLIEEYSLSSSLTDLKIKLDSLLVY